MKNAVTSWAIAAGILTTLTFCGQGVAAMIGCGEIADGIFGPFDYRTVPAESRNLIEGPHFPPEVESLVRGHRGTIGGDISYTLRAMPNHPRALLAMSKLGLKLKTEKPEGARYTVECFFDRAIRWAPDDPMPHLIYGIYLKDRKRKTEALEQLETAAKLKKEMLGYEFPYNMGLGYLDLGVYDKALEYARQAYRLGAPFPGLRRKLEAAGKWSEPSD